MTIRDQLPSQKVTTAGAAGAAITVAVFALQTWTDVDLNEGVATALTTLVAVGLAWLVRETRPAPSAIDTIHDTNT